METIVGQAPPASDKSAPKVSVLMVTYNHERYIAQSVQSALAQETSFPVEIVIGEDCSTDRTREILLDLQRAHPQQIRLLLQEQNIGGPANIAATFAACRGDYVAMLEGDDYWTDPAKLQKQVGALDAHPHWSSCFHLTRRVYTDGSKEPELFPSDWTREEVTIDDLLMSNFICTCSLVFRNRIFGPLPEWHRQITPGDWAIGLLNAAEGPIGCLPDVMADYRIHPQGVWAQKSREFQMRETLRMLTFIDHHFHGKYQQQIDEHRLGLVSYLLGQIDNYKSQVPPGYVPPPQPPVIIVPPPERRRSTAGKLMRQVMRPVEQAVRKWRVA
jgi:glycosyltransferase involved in cell wall biosynthesis